MVRELVMTAGVAALVAIAISAPSFASASDEGGGAHDRGDRKDNSRSSSTLASRGPRLVTSSSSPVKIWNTAQTDWIGSNHGYCVVENPPVAHCAGTVQLDGGTLEYAFQLRLTSPNPPTPAIIGGTGAFDGAEGHGNIHNLNAQGTLTRDTIVLLG